MNVAHTIAAGPRSISHPTEPPVEAPPGVPLWQGAWVGWLGCQTVLLVLVESTSLGQTSSVANCVRLACCALFVTVFSAPCFPSRGQKLLFTLAVLAAEGVVALVAGREVQAPSLVAAGSLVASQSAFARGARLLLLEAAYPVIFRASRLVFRGLFLPRSGASRALQRLLHFTFEGLERCHRTCALQINHQRLQAP